MNEAKKELGAIIEQTKFCEPRIPVYQCVDALPHTNPDELKHNLIEHITHPVLWTDMTRNMAKDGVDSFYEVGTDDTLTKIVARMCPDKTVMQILDIDTYKNVIINYKDH